MLHRNTKSVDGVVVRTARRFTVCISSRLCCSPGIPSRHPVSERNWSVYKRQLIELDGSTDLQQELLDSPQFAMRVAWLIAFMQLLCSFFSCF